MDFSNAFAEAKPLGFFLEQLGAIRDQWLYIPHEISEIDLATPCYVLAIDDYELSPEEQDELDEYPETIGLSCFLSISDLEQVVENLRGQNGNFSNQDLVEAVNYYWRHDAFICHTS